MPGGIIREKVFHVFGRSKKSTVKLVSGDHKHNIRRHIAAVHIYKKKRTDNNSRHEKATTTTTDDYDDEKKYLQSINIFPKFW